jgi:hypothetical protein
MNVNCDVFCQSILDMDSKIFDGIVDYSIADIDINLEKMINKTLNIDKMRNAIALIF